MPTPKIETVNLDMIQPYWKNPRSIPDSAVDAVASSIKEYGFNVPLVLDKKYVIVSGHTRYKALRKLGIKEVPCLVVDLPPKKAREFRLVDNKSHELSDWHVDNLLAELRELNWDRLQTFFPDLDAMIDESVGQIPPSAYVDPPDPKDAFSQRSDDAKEDYIEVMCPQCGELFGLSFTEILKAKAREEDE